MRRALAKRVEAGMRANMPYLLGKLAELDAECQSADEAAAQINEALAMAGETGEQWTDALLHRIRCGHPLEGAIPKSPRARRKPICTAIVIAREQGARSFGLQAALRLAKLHQSTMRSVEAHGVLSPALEGFLPTPEMPKIAEAQALLTALAATDEVKAEAARRQRLTQLHAAQGVALFAARGTAAHSKRRKPSQESASLRSRDEDAPERLAADYGLWVGSYVRGELPSMRARVAAFLSDAEARPEFTGGRRRPSRGRAHLLVRRRIS